MKEERQATQLLSEGRMHIIKDAVYFSSALLNLIPVPSEQVKTLGVTEGMVMYYNPKYICSLTARQVGSRLWHEVQHVIRFTFERSQGIDHRTANIAADLAINSSGRNVWDFNPDGLLPAKFGFPDDLTMEEYLNLLHQGGQGARAILGMKEHGCGSGACGAMAGETKNKELEQKLDAELGRSHIDRLLVQQQVARDIVDYEKSAGRLFGGWGEWARALLTPSKIPWQRQFHAFFRSATTKLEMGGTEYTFARPPRKTIALNDGIARASLVDTEIETVLVLDTSGSMSIQEDIPMALREARTALLRSGATSAWFMEIDAALGVHPRRISVRGISSLKVHGRGGTDFCPAFIEAQKLVPRPQLLIYFTDGIGPAPEHPPKNMEVIWCLIGKTAKTPTGWGRVIRVEA